MNQPYLKNSDSLQTLQMLRIVTPAVLVVLLIISIGYFIGLSSRSANIETQVNTVGPIALFLVFIWAAWTIVRRFPIVIWTPLPWLLFETAAFFGFGPLAYIWGNEATRYKLANSLFRLTPVELLRTNLANSLGIASLFAALYVVSSLTYKSGYQRGVLPNYSSNRVPIALSTSFFLVVGLGIKIFISFPFLYSDSTQVILPGTLRSAATLFELGLAGVAFLAVKRKGVWLILLWVLLPADVIFASLEFSKRNMLIPVILSGLGAYLAHRKPVRLACWLAFCTVIFFFLQPFIQHGRAYVSSVGGGVDNATVNDRIEAIRDYFAGNDSKRLVGRDKEELQEGWMRLSYSGPAGYAMRKHDTGQPGTSIRLAWTLPIPRFVWKEKPELNPGEEFYYSITGRKGTYVGITIYADGYWQFGWFGVVGFGLVAGILLSLMNSHALILLRSHEFIYFPLLLFAIQITMLGPTKFFINGVLGPIPIYLGYWLIVKIFMAHLNGPRSSQTRAV
jgi:hypothetical protein